MLVTCTNPEHRDPNQTYIKHPMTPDCTIPIEWEDAHVEAASGRLDLYNRVLASDMAPVGSVARTELVKTARYYGDCLINWLSLGGN